MNKNYLFFLAKTMDKKGEKQWRKNEQNKEEKVSKCGEKNCEI